MHSNKIQQNMALYLTRRAVKRNSNVTTSLSAAHATVATLFRFKFKDAHSSC
jgi:hypothetical protein